jgi:nicotinamidase-related amidase
MRDWETIFPEYDRQIYEKAGYKGKQAFGQRPALLIIDVITSFTGTKPMEALAAIDEFRSSCGKAAWQALPHIRKLLMACRKTKVPVIYSTSDTDFKAVFGNATKREREPTTMSDLAVKFPQMIHPRKDEYVVHKARASAFFGTHLTTYLTRKNVDSLIVTGCSTSGCVRSTVIDGYSHGFSVFVVEEGTFDRSPFSHLVNLYEMNSKYATVVTRSEVLAHVEALQTVPQLEVAKRQRAR